MSQANSAAGRFNLALASEQPLQIAGAVNAYCAVLAEHAGFRALYLSGAGVANASFALADLGMTTLNDVCEDIRRITAASELPLLVDADTGFGPALMLARTVRQLSRSGAAGMHIEDQVQAKRCGHRPGKALVKKAEMVDRIKAAVDARANDFIIMARTDAVAGEGLEAALERAHAYVEAGADMIFAEALNTLQDYQNFTGTLNVPVLANMTEYGVTPLYSVKELGSVGVSMVLYPLSAFRAMSRAAEAVYSGIRGDGGQKAMLDSMQTRAELYEHLGYKKLEEQLDRLFQASGASADTVDSTSSETVTNGTSLTLPQVSNRFIDPYRYPPGIAYMEEQYLPMSQAKISILDYGFLHSDATYDVVHVRDGRFFRLDRHLQRFFSGMKKLHLDPGKSREEIQDILCHCVGISGLRDAFVEMICTRGATPDFSRDPRQAQNRLLVFAVPFVSVANEEQLRKGLHLAIGSQIRIPTRSVDSKIKNYHWLDLVQGQFEAYELKADNAILLDEYGHVAEGPGFNIFIVSSGALKTPASGVLAGITRETVFDLCAECGYPVRTGDVTVAELTGCDEVFITSTAGGIMPVTRISGQVIGAAEMGPVTRKLTHAYWEKHQLPEWTTPIQYR